VKLLAAKRHITAVTLGFVLICGTAIGADQEVIYGDDDRKDVFDPGNSSALVELARSTAALVMSGTLTPASGQPDAMRLPAKTFGEAYGLCADEPFKQQPNPAFCSGFLVAENILVTAGHCIETQTECSTTSFIFGFSYESQNQDVTLIPKENIYTCKRLVAQSVGSSSETDYAVVELDRAVTDREPLNYRTSGTIEKDTQLTVIGHPAGLPTKIAGGASVRSNEKPAFFVANLDTYGGNSGSAVFNSSSNEVEGILVRGENDFVNNGSCRISYRCTNEGCRGEDVTRATEFSPFVPDPNQPTLPTRNHSVELIGIDQPIPDNDATGVSVNFDVTEGGVLAGVGLHITLDHSYIGDLKITLTHPDGTEAVVVEGSGGSADNIDQDFGLAGVTVPDFMKFKDKSPVGTWKLTVVDSADQDTGTLKYAKLTSQVYIDQ
jgi:subtilisin-like proprotein convertase family protein